MQSAKQSNSTAVPTLATERLNIKRWFGPNLARISLSYIAIIAAGLTTFYFAKKEIEADRIKQMKIKQEISKPNVNYPNRHELMKAQREQAKREQQ